MDFQQNDRLEEWMLVMGDRFRNSNKAWFYLLAVTLVLALPVYLFLSFALSRIFISAVPVLPVNNQQTVKQPLQVVEKKIFELGGGTYGGYARLRNPNAEFGAAEQPYAAEFKAGGQTVMRIPGSTFVLPGSDKIVVFPRFTASQPPAILDLTLGETVFRIAPDRPALTLEIQRRSIEPAENRTLASAVILNRTPFEIKRVDLPVLLYDSAGQVVGANYTNINDLKSFESRSFQYVWYTRIGNAARIEIIPELNLFDRGLLVTEQGSNPFEDID